MVNKRVTNDIKVTLDYFKDLLYHLSQEFTNNIEHRTIDAIYLNNYSSKCISL
jgi:hypothetical protein